MRLILNNGKSVSRLYSTPQPPEANFIFKIDTSLGDGQAEFEFKASHTGAVDYTIDWGDSSTTHVTSNVNSNHIYLAGGVYNISLSIISGLNKPTFYNTNDRIKVTDILNWGTYEWDSFTSFLYDMDNLVNISAPDYPNLQGSNLLQTFIYNSSSLVSLNIGSWVLNSSTSLLQAFRQAPSFNDPTINNLDTTGVFSMSKAFWVASSFNQNLSNWNVESVGDMTDCFLSSALDNVNYRLILIGWTGWTSGAPTKTLQSNVPAHFGTAKYEIGGESEDVRNYLTGTLGWTITDGGGI